VTSIGYDWNECSIAINPSSASQLVGGSNEIFRLPMRGRLAGELRLAVGELRLDVLQLLGLVVAENGVYLLAVAVPGGVPSATRRQPSWAGSTRSAR